MSRACRLSAGHSVGDPERTRTSDQEFRKLLLYPPELRGLTGIVNDIFAGGEFPSCDRRQIAAAACAAVRRAGSTRSGRSKGATNFGVAFALLFCVWTRSGILFLALTLLAALSS